MLRVAFPILLALFLFILAAPSRAAVAWTCDGYDGSADVLTNNISIGMPAACFKPAHNQFYSCVRGRQFLAFTRVKEPCYSTAVQMIIAHHMRPCLVLGNQTLLYAQNPCRSLCDRFLDECWDEFARAGIPPYAFGYFPSGPMQVPEWNRTCDMPDPVYPQYPFFPDGSINYTINGTNEHVVQPCYEPTINMQPASCHDPLVHDGDLYCAFLCPLPSLTDYEYDSAKIMQAIVAWFSWFLTIVLIISYLVNPSLRAFPKNLQLGTAFGANILAGGITLPTFAGYENIWCGGENTHVELDTYFYLLNGNTGYIGVNADIGALTVKSSACSFQGAMILFGFLACTFWWAIIAFNMCLEIYSGSWVSGKAWKYSRAGVYILIGWGIPFLFMLIPTAANKMGFEPAGTFCFLSSEDNYAWILVFFFIPVGLCLLFGSVLFIMGLVKLAYVIIRVRKFKEAAVPYLRLLLFVFIYFLVLGLFGAYTINNSANADTIADGYAAYYQCLSDTTFTPVAECSLDSNVVNYELVMLRGFAISVLGTLLFMLFFSIEIIVHWWKIFAAIGKMFITRDRTSAMAVVQAVGLHSSSTLSSLSGASTMTMTAAAPEEGAEMDSTSSDTEEQSGDASSSSSD